MILRILGHISEALRGNFMTSKRDIFYKEPLYFGSQRIVDVYVDDIAYTIGVDRAALHVVWIFDYGLRWDDLLIFGFRQVQQRV